MKYRRTILKVITLLAAGAALNVAVAWGLAYFVTFGEIDHYVRINNQELAFRVAGGSEWVADGPYSMGYAMAGRPLPEENVQGHINELWKVVLADDEISGYEARGWPSVALAWFYLGAGPDNPVRTVPEVRHGLQLGGSQNMHRYILTGRVLPLRPLWPGFAINTLFYAGVLWMLFAGPFALRRMIRRRRGQCPHCAYPIGQNQRCTECGAAVMPKATNA